MLKPTFLLQKTHPDKVLYSQLLMIVIVVDPYSMSPSETGIPLVHWHVSGADGLVGASVPSLKIHVEGWEGMLIATSKRHRGYMLGLGCSPSWSVESEG